MEEVKPEKESGEGRESTVAASVVIPKDSSESAAKDLVSRWLIESSAFHVGLSNGNTEPDYNDLIVRIESALTAARDSERERCATVALEQRCERGTPWDLACLSIAAAIRATTQPDDDLKIQNVESQVSVSALPESGSGSESSGSSEVSSSVNCVCGETFEWPVNVANSEHVHCPSCGSHYNAQQSFLISKRQVKTLQTYLSEWSK